MAQSSVKFGSVGIWTRQFEDHPAAKVQEAAGELEELGYGAIWFGEAAGREALTHAGLLLAATRRIVVATGIANIYARDPVTMASGQKTLAEAYPDRFVLGLGVSHVPLVEQLRGHQYEKPVPRMRAYLDAMDQAPYRSVPPPSKPVRVLAALRPKMLELAAQRADGAHPYNVNPEHTARARKILGAGRYLCPEQAVVLETDPAKARKIGRDITPPAPTTFAFKCSPPTPTRCLSANGVSWLPLCFRTNLGHRVDVSAVVGDPVSGLAGLIAAPLEAGKPSSFQLELHSHDQRA